MGELIRECVKADEVIENYRPGWLNGMELDFWVPEWNLAFEFQGDQHFVPVFGLQAHQDQKVRDRIKKQICADRGVMLLCFEAYNLRERTLRRKLLHHIRVQNPDFTKCHARHELKKILRKGNWRQSEKAKSKYCKAIKQLFGSPTAHRKGSKVRDAATAEKWAGVTPMERVESNRRALARYGQSWGKWKKRGPSLVDVAKSVAAPKYGLGVAKAAKVAGVSPPPKRNHP